MARVVEVIDRKQKAKAEESARLKREADERMAQEAAAAKKSWYRFW